MRNTSNSYGWVAIALHWVMAMTIFSLFALGLYMVELTYYDPLYNALPAVHKSVGILLALLLVVRIFWRWSNPVPAPVPGSPRLAQQLARFIHRTFYLMIAAILVSGYLISTADGSAISVFDLFSVPATIVGIPGQEDNAGLAHQYLAYGLMALVALHVGKALKHHFIDRDNTLRRILGVTRR